MALPRLVERVTLGTLQHGPLQVKIESDGRLLMDLNGVNKWGHHCFNSTPTAIQAGVWIGLTQTAILNEKVNDGAYLATETHIPPGTWANPQVSTVSTTLSWCSFLTSITGLFKTVSTGFVARGFLEEVVAGYPWTGNITQGGGLFGGYPASAHQRHIVADTDLKERIDKRLPYPVSVRDPENSEMNGLVEGDELLDRNVKNVPVNRKEYDVYVSTLSAGHGVGDVLDRSVEDVIEDLNEDLVLERFAESAYGIVASQGEDGDWTADLAATEARREAIRKERLARSLPVSEWLEQQQPLVANMGFSKQTRKMFRESLELSI